MDNLAHYDPEAVRFFDIAHEGAQVRLVSESIESIAAPLHGLTVRSVVLLPTDPIARTVAQAAVSLIEPMRAPVVVTESLPQYVGALDVVVVVGELGECEWAARALSTAAGRGATTVLIAPSQGPLLADAPSQTLALPNLPSTDGGSPARYLAALYAVVSLIDNDPQLVARQLEAAAEAVDSELGALSPEHDSVVNPGRQLREFVEGAAVFHTHGIGKRSAVARCAADIWAAHGLSASYAAPESLPRIQQRRPAVDTFYDPYLDGAGDSGALVPLRFVLWGQEEANLPNCLAVTTTEPGESNLAGTLQLITRAYAATAYDM